jgi:hypothetical protein
MAFEVTSRRTSPPYCTSSGSYTVVSDAKIVAEVPPTLGTTRRRAGGRGGPGSLTPSGRVASPQTSVSASATKPVSTTSPPDPGTRVTGLAAPVGNAKTPPVRSIQYRPLPSAYANATFAAPGTAVAVVVTGVGC